MFANFIRLQSQIRIRQVLCKMLSNSYNYYEATQGPSLVLTDFSRVSKFVKKKGNISLHMPVRPHEIYLFRLEGVP